LLTLVILAGLGFGAWFSYGWTQTQYFLGVNHGEVTLFRGINQSIGTWDLYHAVEGLGVRNSDLAPVVQQRLEKSISLRSREEARALIASWRDTGMIKGTKKPTPKLVNPTTPPTEATTSTDDDGNTAGGNQ
ncbi:serine/threonine-protein phosphatase, partial [Mobiluncus curtisii]|nr:serine/threonine-protein phosphatase [Mobiluncus curtisii]